ncbi:ExeA family protein [Candidatus Margulisiibacteriota bacterium]
MLNSYFGFHKLPFAELVNHNTIFQTSQISFLLKRFADFTVTKGIALLTGDSGSGKTTLLNFLLANLDNNRFKPIYLVNYPQSAKAFLRLFISKLGYLPKFFMEDILIQLPNILSEFKAQTKMRPFLILDEAHNISPSVLEQIRLLTCLDSDFAPIIVFAAHSGFKDKLYFSCFQALRYRLSFIFMLETLSKIEIKDYISFHLKLAGLTRDIFSDDAITQIFNLSRGLPRLINRIATEALYLAAEKNISDIDHNIIDIVAKLGLV